MKDSTGTVMPGDVIGDRYLVRGPLGRGGEGRVFRVTDLKLGKDWAMKVIAAEHSGPAGAETGELYREVRTLRALSHPNLPRITDIVEIECRLCIVMDLIEGRTLADVVKEEGAQPQEKVLSWARQLGEVLAYLHARKPPVIYRDMKPGNIMLRPDGRIILFDFGTAREQKEKAPGDTVCLGTYGYAAPEQYGGSGQTSPRTDIYGLGATLYHLLSGRSPSEPPYEMLPLRMIDPRILPGLERIVLTCTNKDPALRYENAEAFLDALDRVRNGKAAGTRIAKKTRRHLHRVSVPVLGTAFLMALSAFFAQKAAGESRREAYAAAMTDAADLAAESCESRQYDPAVAAHYREAIDIDKAREEAYLELIDYMQSVGQTNAGLRCVTARLDAEDGTGSGKDAVLLAVAELYFAGSDEDPSFVRDYGKAARYYAAVDPDVCPQAPYFASVASILSDFSDAVDWESALSRMREFERWSTGQPLSVSRVRNMRILAGVYLANRRELLACGIDPHAEAVRLLCRAREDAEALTADLGAGPDGIAMMAASRAYETSGTDLLQELLNIRKMILRDLAGVYSSGAAGNTAYDPDEAIRCLSDLLDLTEEEDEICRIRLRLAACMILAGRDEEAREMYEMLITGHPSYAAAYVDYASYLLSAGDGGAAAEVYRKAETCPDAENEPNFASIGMKLKNAGLI